MLSLKRSVTAAKPLCTIREIVLPSRTHTRYSSLPRLNCSLLGSMPLQALATFANS
jgi:hypothetical protein